MSLASIVGKYPLAAGFMQAASTLISAAPATFSDTNISAEETAAIADGVMFLVPLFDVSTRVLPSCAEITNCDQLWLRLQGKTEITVTTFDLVCDIVGGGKLAGDRLAAGQMGVTLKGIAKVLVPRPWVLAQAKAAKLFKLVPALGATAGKGTVSDNPAMARGWDLDGNPWGCLDKRGAQVRLNPLMALTRLFSAAKMEKFCDDILFDHEKLRGACMTLRSTGGKFADESHPDAGLHLYAALHRLAVMKDGFGPGSKMQHALLLHFSSLDHTKVSLVDFLEVDAANEAIFDRDRCTPTSRGLIRGALEYVETFFEAFSGPGFKHAFLPLTESLKTDSGLWNGYDDQYVLFRISNMLQTFSENVRTHKLCTLDAKRSLATSADCGAYLNALAIKTLTDAEACTGGWTKDSKTFYALDYGVYHEIKQRPKTVEGKALKRKARDEGAPYDPGGDGELEGAKKSGAGA
ncbi:hypothetical protein B484DRAFT_408842, partial [Ochromonadaceae sp. CCMP2298]